MTMADQGEAARLKSLRSYGVLDTPPEAAFDRLTNLAAELFETPIALVSLIDEQRQWFKSRHGLEATETPRDLAFCAHAIRQQPGTTFVVEDASRDPRFQFNPLVTSDPNIRFYAGAVLTGSAGHNLGTLCVIDRKPRPALTPKEQQRLLTLANIVVDELELRRARLQVEEKNGFLDLAENMSGVGRWRFDVGSRKLTWSNEVFRIHGLPVGGGEPDLEAALTAYDQHDRAKLGGLLERALMTGEGYQSEARLRRPNGEIRNVTAKARCVLDETGAVQSVIGVFQDVTEQVKASRFLRTVTDNIPGKVAYWDSDLRCRFANIAYREWFGLLPEQMLGMKLQDLLGETLFAQNEPYVRAAMRGEPQTFERTLTKLSGEVGHLWANYLPDIDDAGQVKGMFVLVADVTALKQQELQLEQANLLLTEALDQAEAATAVKSEFLANMSHEIRTPLTAIIGFTSILAQRSDLDASARAQVSRVAGAGRALLAIVNDILDFSKLEAGQLKIEPRPVALTALLRETLLMFSPAADAKGLELQFAAADGLPDAVLIDPDKTRQVLINLIGNALKFTDQGFVRLAARHDAATSRLDICVEDTGAGMTASQQDVLFQRFSQVDASSTRRHGGTGLGLAISKGLIEAMDGEIGVRSAPGKGTVFHFNIAAPMETPHARPEPDEAPTRQLEGLRVLVIDDNPANRELARVFLERSGAVVTGAADGFAGLEIAAAEPMDAILLDLRMPRLNGSDVLARLRATDGPNQEIPVLAFTADCDLGRLGENHGFNGLVRKPLISGDLAGTILEAVNGELMQAMKDGARAGALNGSAQGRR